MSRYFGACEPKEAAKRACSEALGYRHGRLGLTIKGPSRFDWLRMHQSQKAPRNKLLHSLSSLTDNWKAKSAGRKPVFKTEFAI